MYYRKIFDKTDAILTSKQISFIIWSRQVGKTTFLRRMYMSIDSNNKVWLNLDNFEYHGLFQSFSLLESFLQSQYSWTGIFYLFLDEFQKVKKIDTILKLIYDELPWVKVIASGSNSIEINKNIHESFAGRKRVYTLYPLDFDEYLLWMNVINSIEEVNKFYNNPLNQKKISSHLKDFMIWGGYPEVVLAKTNNEKEQVLHSIFDYWFNRDIVLYTDKLFECKALLSQLSFRVGNTLSYAELGTLTHLTGPTIKRFISILEEIYICFSVMPFFTNKLKELSRAPKLYFYDPGSRNILIKRFDFSPEEYGILFENFIFTELLKRGKELSDIRFWRTKNEQNEVDIVLPLEELAIECKYREESKKSDTRWLLAFGKEHSSMKTQVVYVSNFWKLWE
jgi:uncharacterized protein